MGRFAPLFPSYTEMVHFRVASCTKTAGAVVGIALSECHRHPSRLNLPGCSLDPQPKRPGVRSGCQGLFAPAVVPGQLARSRTDHPNRPIAKQLTDSGR